MKNQQSNGRLLTLNFNKNINVKNNHLAKICKIDKEDGLCIGC